MSAHTVRSAYALALAEADVRELLLGLSQQLSDVQRDVRALRLAVERPPRPARASDGALLAAIAQSAGSVAFNAADLVARMARDDRRDDRLRAHFGKHGRDARALGRLLSALHRRAPAGGFRLVRIGRDRRGALWSVEEA